MKIIRYLMTSFLGILLFASCKSYLDQTPAAVITDKDIFSTYASFQGFLDPNYAEIENYTQHYPCTTMNMGGDTYSLLSYANAYLGNTGDYIYAAGSNTTGGTPPSLYISSYTPYGQNTPYGIWTGGWRGIRVCNIALKNLKLLSDATDEEKKLLEGQIYFFKAFFHNEIITAYGGMPYVDSVYTASDEPTLPRLTYQACTERIVQDFDKAAALLPDNWDNTAVGAARGIGSNTGRFTKGMALAYKQKALLYAASPLMNKFSGKDATYDVDLCKRAAAAGWEMIKFANTGQYSLVPWANYTDNFYKLDGTIPWTSETIFERVDYKSGQYLFIPYAGPPRMGCSSGGSTESVNQLYVDKFEMADGTRYKPEYDQIDAKRWENRDPRFRKDIIIDREVHGSNALAKLYLYDPIYGDAGSDKTVAGKIALPYLVKKFWPAGVNTYDKKWTQFRMASPRMRLAEVYLDYAEAVTAAYGPLGSAPGAALTAVDAINIIRARPGLNMPPVTAAATGYANFMDLVRNERNVELCFEGHYWFDIRRWYIAHLAENKPIIDLQFNKAWTPTTFNRSLFMTRTFDDPKQYWLPIDRNVTLLYPGMYQNPGWN